MPEISKIQNIAGAWCVLWCQFSFQKTLKRQIYSFHRELSFEYLFVFCKIWGILTCFWLIWLSKSHFSFARKILEANQFLSPRAFVWVHICILQNLRHFDMFLTCLILKMSFFICQKNPWLRFLLMSNGNPMTT